MKELLEKIELMLPGLDGWTESDKAFTLAAYVVAFKPKVVVEVGVWGGRSAISMMLACQRNHMGKVICVDPWKPEESVKGQDNALDRKWWGDQNHEIVYQKFLKSVERMGVGAHCEVWRNSSDNVPVPANMELLHIDGNHGPQALKDAQHFAPSLPIRGLCVLDDIGWTGGHVKEAETFLLASGFMKLHPLGTGAVYIRVR